MLPITREWATKAESDYDVVLLLLRSRKPSRFDPICFHSQQCVEKYLKARLTEAGIAFPKSHDLVILLNLCVAAEPFWTIHLAKMKFLTQWAILACYPGASATTSDAKQAVGICRGLRRVAREGLGI
jgi:HEPN domain-containing protein